MHPNTQADKRGHQCTHMRKIHVRLANDARKVFVPNDVKWYDRGEYDLTDAPELRLSKMMKDGGRKVLGSKAYATAGRFHYANTRSAEMYVPCGHCVECKRKKSHEWSTRLDYEWYAFKEMHPNACRLFLTLTFNDRFEVMHKADTQEFEKGSYGYIQDFLKRLRQKNSYLGEFKFRYFAVGEFGEKNDRFHYHVLLFVEDRASLPDYIETSELLTEWKEWYMSFKNGDSDKPQLSQHWYKSNHGNRGKKCLTTGIESTMTFILGNFFWYDSESYRVALSKRTKGLKPGSFAYLKAVEQAKVDANLGILSCAEVKADAISGYMSKYLNKYRDADPREFESFHRQSVRLGEAYFFKQYVAPIYRSHGVEHKDWRLSALALTDIFYQIPKVIDVDKKGVYKCTTPRSWYRKFSNDRVRVAEWNSFIDTYNYQIESDNNQKHDIEKAEALKRAQNNTWLRNIKPNSTEW